MDRRGGQLVTEIRMIWHKYSSVHNQEDKVFMTLADMSFRKIHVNTIEIPSSHISVFARNCFAGNPDNYETKNLVSLFSARLKYLCDEGFLSPISKYKFTITELGLVLYRSITAYIQSRSYVTMTSSSEEYCTVLGYVRQRRGTAKCIKLAMDYSPMRYEYIRTPTEITMQKLLDNRATEIYEINIPTVKETLMPSVVLRPLPLSLNPDEIKHLIMITENSAGNSIVRKIEVFDDNKKAVVWAEEQVREGGKNYRAVLYSFMGSCVLQAPPVEWTTPTV